MDAKSLNAVLENICRRAHVENKGWHAFRRGWTTDAHEQGVPDKEITQYLGWKTPTMVFRYIQLSSRKAEKTVVSKSSFFQGDK